MRTRRRAIALVLVGVVSIGAILVLNRPWAADTYALEGDRTVVIFASSPVLSWIRVTSVVENPTTVTIGLTSLAVPLPLPGTGGPLKAFPVELAAPLGSRSVIDGTTGVTLIQVPVPPAS